MLQDSAIQHVSKRDARPKLLVVVVVGCVTPQQHAGVSQRQICSDNCTSCHTEIEISDPTLSPPDTVYRPSADPIQARRLAGWPLEDQFLSHWYDLLASDIADRPLKVFNSLKRCESWKLSCTALQRH